MSTGLPDYYSSTQKCQWCGRKTEQIEKGQSCQDRICDRCIIKKGSCQSDCPICWERNISSFIRDNEICSVCCSGINFGDKVFKCPKQHAYCSSCTSGGCWICQFHDLKARNDEKHDDRSSHYERIIYTCQVWQTKFEESQSSTSRTSKSVHSNKSSSLIKEGENKSKNVSGSQEKNSVSTVENGDCMVCLERLGSESKKLDKCGHRFHSECIDTWFQSSGKQSCPTCGYVYGISKGPQPSNGQMKVKYLSRALPGFEDMKSGYKDGPTIEINYLFPSGIQGPLNPYPGKPFTGTTRTAYLPNNKEGKEILGLLRRAFDDGHIFTIGRSSTTGQDNVVTWNDIHHKTSITGGPERFGYPDPTYLFRVRQELNDKGYK